MSASIGTARQTNPCMHACMCMQYSILRCACLIGRELCDWTDNQRMALAKLYMSTGCWTLLTRDIIHSVLTISNPSTSRALPDRITAPGPCQGNGVYARVFDRMMRWTQHPQMLPPCWLLDRGICWGERFRVHLYRTKCWHEARSNQTDSVELFSDLNLTRLSTHFCLGYVVCMNSE